MSDKTVGQVHVENSAVLLLVHKLTVLFQPELTDTTRITRDELAARVLTIRLALRTTDLVLRDGMKRAGMTTNELALPGQAEALVDQIEVEISHGLDDTDDAEHGVTQKGGEA